MIPSTNFLALVRAFDNITPPAASREEMRQQVEALLDANADCVAAVSSLFSKPAKSSIVVRNRFDALLSVACDTGLEAFFASPLPDLARVSMSSSVVRRTFLSMPENEGILRDNLLRQFRDYGMKALSRRAYEAELFLGNPVFYFGRTLSDLPAITQPPTTPSPASDTQSPAIDTQSPTTAQPPTDETSTPSICLTSPAATTIIASDTPTPASDTPASDTPTIQSISSHPAVAQSPTATQSPAIDTPPAAKKPSRPVVFDVMVLHPIISFMSKSW